MISIIIPVFNQAAYTKACLDALLLTCGDSSSFEIVIVDNCSSDDTPSLIEEFKKTNTVSIQYCRNQKNLGFTIASNQGASMARGETLVFLNNDTIPQAGWRESLEKALNDSAVGIVGPRLLYPNTLEVNHAGYVYNPKVGGFYPIYLNYPGNFNGVLKERNFQALLGACLMMKRKTFEDVNGFTEIGLEDIDLCLRVGRRGLKIRYVPDAVVYHHGSVTQTNSAIGTVPVYSNTDFTERWKDKGLKWDDFYYYIEDQILPFAPLEKAADSYALLQDAMVLISQGALSRAYELVNKSVEAFPGNTDALSELLILAINKLELDQAKALGLELLKQGCYYGEAIIFVAIVYKKLGMKNEMLDVISMIESLQWCSSDTKSMAREMRQSNL